MSDIELREIDFGNLDEIAELRVTPGQMDLVADNAYSIAQALLDPEGDCCAAYEEDRAVGFLYTRLLDEGRRLYLCRFMVDHRQQGRGLGRRMLMELLHTAFASEELECVDLAVSSEPGSAEGFYQKCGFVPTDEPYKGGRRML
ncbi:MAG: GNAT family N-acetyltransferase, partial [Verrucomicrobiaceae bacterium]|nr:GNAT family N-acetyltransferase [Verrucomicrobiaceae bacterium]